MEAKQKDNFFVSALSRTAIPAKPKEKPTNQRDHAARSPCLFLLFGNYIGYPLILTRPGFNSLCVDLLLAT
jgi:hypothetical protein